MDLTARKIRRHEGNKDILNKALIDVVYKNGEDRFRTITPVVFKYLPL